MANKVKLRNLDPEVLALLGNSNGENGFYNDEELRSRIQNLEDNTFTKQDASLKFVSKEEGVIKEAFESGLNSLKDTVTTQFDEKISNIEANTVKKEPETIQEQYLTSELRQKINAASNIDMTPFRSEFATITDIANLKDRATNHESNIDGIKRSLHNDYLQKTDRIKMSNLNDELRNKIENSRMKSTPITLGDLDENLRSRISTMASPDSEDPAANNDFEKIRTFMNKFAGRKNGEIFYAIHNDELGTDDISSRYVYSDKITVIAQSSLLAEVEEWASTYNKDYIVDVQENAVYLYKTATSSWERQEKTAYNFMAGQMASEYVTGDIYFGTSTENCKKIMSNGGTKIQYSTKDIVAGITPLDTGSLYIVYEE